MIRNKLHRGITRLEHRAVRPNAWVYFIWAVMGESVYCKIGYTGNPHERIYQISSSIPTTPFFLQLLPCLSTEQAKLFETTLHQQADVFRAKTRSEWFTHPNFNRLHKAIQAKVDEIVQLAQTFGYAIELQEIDRPGPYPVLHPNGYVDYVVDPKSQA